MVMLEQVNIFGGIEVIDTVQEAKAKTAKARRYARMQEMYGKTAGHKCRECGHLLCNKYGERRYYKCELWRVTHCISTDIRLSDDACGMFADSCDDEAGVTIGRGGDGA